MNDWPFIILVGFDKNIRNQEISEIIISRASGIFIIGFILVAVLLIFRKALVLPVVTLSKIAEKIIESDGKEKVVIPHFNIQELEILSFQLIKLEQFIKQLKFSEQELKDSRDDLEKAHNSLEVKVLERTILLKSAIEAKTEFLNNMNHEIRTPMHGFTVLSEGLVEHWYSFDEEKKLYLAKQVASNAQRLMTFISNLLDLSKFGADKMQMNFSSFYINDFIENIIDEFNSLYSTTKLVQINFLQEVKIKVTADEEKIGQVLRNLLANAIKFCDPNEGFIEIKLYKESASEVAHVQVKDNGVGITTSELEAIFEPFYQSSNTKTKAGETGLGLSICKEIIVGHNGAIWAENNQDQNGSNFHFSIPLSQTI
jgi:two-component system sensor histidine kinase ChiS